MSAKTKGYKNHFCKGKPEKSSQIEVISQIHNIVVLKEKHYSSVKWLQVYKLIGFNIDIVA